jgi:hypothetical protein
MKKSTSSNLLLPLLICLFVSCQKQQLEDVIQCQSIAYVIDKTDALGKILATDTSICWPQVCGEDLQRFRAMSKDPQPICGQPGSFMRLVIWTSEQKKIAVNSFPIKAHIV